jgi:hypothetical protein
MRPLRVEPHTRCIRLIRTATFADMESISNRGATDLLLYVSSLPYWDRLAVIEAMRDVFPQLKHDRRCRRSAKRPSCSTSSRAGTRNR